MPKLGTKNALFGYFWPKYLIWVFLGNNFKKTIVIFEISTLKFVYLQNFTKKQKKPNFGTKKAWFMYFLAGIWKQYCHIWNQHAQLFLTAKFREKKCLNLGPKMPYLVIFGQWFWKIVLSYFKSAPSNLFNCKILRKNKSP